MKQTRSNSSSLVRVLPACLLALWLAQSNCLDATDFFPSRTKVRDQIDLLTPQETEEKDYYDDETDEDHGEDGEDDKSPMFYKDR